MDSTTTPVGAMAVEWGAVTLQIKEPRLTLAVPQLLVRLGVTSRVEIGLRGSYSMSQQMGQSFSQGATSAGNLGFYGKWVLISGALQNRHWPRPSIALFGGAQFLTADSTWGLEARLAGSFWIGPVLTHLNLGFRHEGRAAVLAGAVLSVPLSFGLTPAVEMSGEVRFSETSVASILIGASQAIPHLPLAIDVAMRRGLTPATPDWTVTAGLTMQLRLWQPLN